MQGQSIPINWTASAGADSYQLQRKADGGEWETIYTGANFSFEDTAGAWTTVQYQVAAGLSGEYGEYATSAVIPVISASALVISGSDEDLGTITADIPYTVTSDTGNQITHTLTVNGVQFATATEASGVAHSIAAHRHHRHHGKRAGHQRPCDGNPDVDIYQGPHLLPGCCWRRGAAKEWTELPAGHPGRVGSHKSLLGRDP